MNVLKPPSIVRGLTELNRRLFEKEVEADYLHLSQIKISSVLPLIKNYLLKMEKFKPIRTTPEEGTEIYLNPEVVSGWGSLPEEVRKGLEQVEVNDVDLKRKKVMLKYEHYSAEAVFRAVLPEEKNGFSSFTRTGHIVHVNLREHLLPYKRLIGEVLFDKVPGCRSVVNKTDGIDNTYRNFSMEVLKGDGDMVTTVRENGCNFRFDFSVVYWNSRLCTEHERIVQRLRPGDVLFDVFAGVGPFSVPAGKKRCHVYANDLNPESFLSLVSNAKANKAWGGHFLTFNKDGADFIRQDFKRHLPRHLDTDVYVTMNLPSLAPTFLKHFVGLFDRDELEGMSKPVMMFVYCFAKGEDYTTIAKQCVSDGFGMDVSDKIIDIFRVRTVSSLKEMMRVTVSLDRDVLERGKRKLEDGEESRNKRVMGKNKNKPKNVFKVAGSKTIKLKNKAKAVKTELKRINVKTKAQVTEIDKALAQLEDKVRTSVPTKGKGKEPVRSKLPTGQGSLETTKKSNEATEDLNKMQL